MSSERPTPQPANALADAIRSAREHAGLSAAELAMRAELEPSTLEAIERGEGTLELETIRKLAEALGVSTAELFGLAKL